MLTPSQYEQLALYLYDDADSATHEGIQVDGRVKITVYWNEHAFNKVRHVYIDTTDGVSVFGRGRFSYQKQGFTKKAKEWCAEYGLTL